MPIQREYQQSDILGQQVANFTMTLASCSNSGVFQAELVPSSISVIHITYASVSKEADAQKFARLSEEWEKETGGWSNVSRRIRHQAYQQILLMGERAVPFMLRDFQHGKYEDWFWALSLATGVNPIPPDAAGDVETMAKAWIKWGRDKHLLND